MEVHQWVGSSTPYLTPAGDTWAEEAAGHGRVGSQRITFAGETTPPAEISEALRLEPGQLAVMRRRIVLLDEQPVEIADSFWPASIARGTPLAEPRKIRGGAVAFLAQIGRTPARVDEDVSARPATPDERQTLAMIEGDWVLILTRLIADAAENPYEVSVMTTAGRARRLHYSMKVG